jgi:hypothetical protein
MGNVSFLIRNQLSANVMLQNLGSQPWDEYPFILLNLFLSIIASLQGPIIMMSQNRQQKVDQIQNDYVSKIILRGEHQTRHINAKMDHLITNQWGRLLEIQEIQVDLLQILQTQQSNIGIASSKINLASPLQSAKSINKNELDQTLLRVPEDPRQPLKTEPFSLEIDPDDHTQNLLSIYYQKPSLDPTLLFSHWTEQGDNFYGITYSHSPSRSYRERLD